MKTCTHKFCLKNKLNPVTVYSKLRSVQNRMGWFIVAFKFTLVIIILYIIIVKIFIIFLSGLQFFITIQSSSFSVSVCIVYFNVQITQISIHKELYVNRLNTILFKHFFKNVHVALCFIQNKRFKSMNFLCFIQAI